MLIVDSQIHLYEGHGAAHHNGGRAYPVERAIADMEAAGVHGAVNHPPYWNEASHAYAIEAARAYPDRLATLGWVDLAAPHARDEVRSWREKPGWIGLRYICVSDYERSWSSDGTMDWLWPMAEELGIPIALGGPLLVPLAGRLAERHPDLKITIDHLGFVDFTADHRLIQHPQIHSWARHQNVSVKLTGVPDYAGGDPYPFTSTHEAVRRLYDAYGPDRLFWGTDITRLPCTWRESISIFTEEMPFLSTEDLRLIMGEAFCSWFGWRPDVSMPEAQDAAGASDE